jgi:hypothetical protein
MPSAFKSLFGLLLLFTLALAIVITAGRVFWGRTTSGAVDALFSSEAPVLEASAGEAELPPPVRRYLARALPEAAPQGLRAARFRQQGEFRIGADWHRFEAEHWAHVERPGFVWDARIAVAPILSVLVRDSYLAGRASMRASLGGLYGLVDAEPTPELAEAALQRYLAEAVWYPPALRPSARLRWEPVTDARARAVLSDAGLEVAVEFEFDPAGDIVGVSTPARYREVEGGYVPTPWRGLFSEHAERAGMRIPLAGEVGWEEAGALNVYWRARLVEAEYRL